MGTEVLQEIREIKQEIVESLSLSQPVLSLRQFCKLADISIDFGYQLTSKRKIPFYRPFGKRIYIDREEAISFLKRNKVNSLSQVEQLATHDFLTSKIVGR